MTVWIRPFVLLLAILATGCSHHAHTSQPYGSRPFSSAELDQMLAPIALYPDVILSQVLMASTYPLDLEDAAAWSRDHPHLRGSEAVDAVAGYNWDPSVMALVAFPGLLLRLDEDSGWTQRLGTAYLYQEGEVLASVQRLRDHAYGSGHLGRMEHLHAYRHDAVIVIEPVNPRLVYLPFYHPLAVYGDWWWPSHPPHYWRHQAYPRSGVSFFWSDGFALGSGFFFSGVHWHNRHIVTFDRRHYRPFNNRGNYYSHYVNPRRWHHQPRRHDGSRYKYAAPGRDFGNRLPEYRRDGRRDDRDRSRDGWQRRDNPYGPDRDHRDGWRDNDRPRPDRDRGSWEGRQPAPRGGDHRPPASRPWSEDRGRPQPPESRGNDSNRPSRWTGDHRPPEDARSRAGEPARFQRPAPQSGRWEGNRGEREAVARQRRDGASQSPARPVETRQPAERPQRFAPGGAPRDMQRQVRDRDGGGQARRPDIGTRDTPPRAREQRRSGERFGGERRSGGDRRFGNPTGTR